LIPLLIMLDANGNEITRGAGTLTSTQPAGNYFVQVQPQAGSGYYNLLLQKNDVPLPSGPFVSTVVTPSSINAGETALVSVSLNNVPAEGYTSAEFTCTYDANLVEVSNIVVANLFGADVATAMSGPQSGKFILAIAGSKGNKATTSGTVFTFNVRGLQAGQTAIECTARVSKGDNVLSDLPSIGTGLAILGNLPTPTVTPSITPFVPTATPSQPANSPTPSITPGGPTATATPIASIAYDFATNACTATWSSGAGQLPCPGTDGDANGFVLKVSNPILETGVTDTRPGLLTFPQNIQNGYIQGIFPPFRVQNGDRFRSIINCESGAVNCYVLFRLDYQIDANPINTLWAFVERYEGQYYSVDINLSLLAGKDVKFILTVLSAGSASGDRALWVGPIIYRADAGSTPVPSATPTLISTENTYQNIKYGFEFKYPHEGQIVDGRTDNFAHINLPRMPGTNLGDKYLEVIVAENANPCQSPLATESILETSETVIINGISFLKQTGGDATAGHINTWTAYSTMRDNACVSLDFVLRAADPGVFTTPPPLYDEAVETAVFGQIVSTYAWLIPPITVTPTFTPTPIASPTATPIPALTLTGQVLASKPVTVSLYNADNSLAASVIVNSDGTFSLTAPAGTYTVFATASGYLSAQGSTTLTSGNASTLSTVSLPAGDIDNNNVINQFDAMTIGMSYNTTVPAAADLNNDGIINVLDLELLARNYRRVGPLAWQ